LIGAEFIYLGNSKGVEVYTLQGNVHGQLSIGIEEGEIILLHAQMEYLIMV
jgi:hypothetical protein